MASQYRITWAYRPIYYGWFWIVTDAAGCLWFYSREREQCERWVRAHTH